MDFLLAILPSVGVLALFWVGVRALVHADRRERLARARIETAEDAAHGSAGEPGEEPTGTVRPGPGDRLT